MYDQWDSSSMGTSKLMLEIAKSFKGDSRFQMDQRFQQDVDVEKMP